MLSFEKKGTISKISKTLFGECTMNSTSTSTLSVKFNGGSKTATSISFATIYVNSGDNNFSAYTGNYYACGY